MALDYSKLSDEELEALEKGDYSKLSDATLQALASEQQPKAAPQTQTQAQPQPPEPTAADYAELVGLGAGGAGAAYGAYKLSPTIQVAKKVIDVVRNPASKQVAETVIDVARNALTPSAPVAPSAPAAPATSPILDAQGRPMVRTPVAPTAPTPAPTAPAPQAQTGIIDKASQMVRQLAANRVVQGAARIGGTVTAALMPGNVGQNYPFPQSGPMRGQEINPSTGRPWSKEELDAYRAQYGG